jgi:hypothetical protein
MSGFVFLAVFIKFFQKLLLHFAKERLPEARGDIDRQWIQVKAMGVNMRFASTKMISQF